MTSGSTKVLIVEDDHRLLGALSRRMKEIGCACVSCDNASEAMLQFATGGFDLVVTDLTMPEMDGMSIIAMIRSQSDIPIIVVTGHAEEYARVLTTYRRITMIRKPFHPLTFVARVRATIATIGVSDARVG